MNGLGFMNAVYATSTNSANLYVAQYSNYTTPEEIEAQNQSESYNIHINTKDTRWKQDNIDKQYLSKTYNVTANADIKSYKITVIELSGENVERVKITNNQNKETREFVANEEFKVLVPIKNMTKIGTFKLIVERSNKTNYIWRNSIKFSREWMCFNKNN